MLGRFLIILLLEITAMAAFAILAALRPGPWTMPVILISSTGGIVAIIVTVFRMLWRPMLGGFPAREPAPDAVRRRFQTFGVGMVNMGLSIHVAVDDEYLHLTPLPICQKLGAIPVSIPWSAMEPVGHSGRVVRVDGHRIDGPKWCLELAAPADDA